MRNKKTRDNSPPSRDHRLPFLFPPGSEYESPESPQKTPHWASIDRGSLFRRTLIQEYQTAFSVTVNQTLSQNKAESKQTF